MFLVPLALAVAFALLSAVAAVAVWLTWTFAAEKWRYQLKSAAAKLESSQDSNSHNHMLMESFTMGWLNVLFQHTWTPILEKHISHLAAGVLQRVLNAVVREHGSKAPLKYLEGVAVEEVTFGLVPPSFQLCFAKYDPRKNILHLSMNLRFNSSGFQAVLCPKMKQIGRLKPFEFRVEITHLMLAGRLNLALHLTKEAPGVSKMDYSFATEPELDLKFRPVGMGLGEVPVVVTALRRQLQRVIHRQLVEPRRRTLDVKRIYNNRHILKAGGPGGLLRVVLLGVTGLSPQQQSGQQQEGNSAQGPTLPRFSLRDLYVEVRFGQEVYRTPIARDLSWNWQLDMPLLAELGCHAGQDKLRFEVLSARTVGDPDRVAVGKVSLQDTGITPNSEPCLLSVPLKSPIPNITPVLSMTMAVLKAVRAPNSPVSAKAGSAPAHNAFATPDLHQPGHAPSSSSSHPATHTAHTNVSAASTSKYPTPGAPSSSSAVPATQHGSTPMLVPHFNSMPVPAHAPPMSQVGHSASAPVYSRGGSAVFESRAENGKSGQALTPRGHADHPNGVGRAANLFMRHSMGTTLPSQAHSQDNNPHVTWGSRLQATASMLSMSTAAHGAQDTKLPARCSSWDQQKTVEDRPGRAEGHGSGNNLSSSSGRQQSQDHKRSLSEGQTNGFLGRILGNGQLTPEPGSSPTHRYNGNEGSLSPVSMTTGSESSSSPFAPAGSPGPSSPATAFEVEPKALDSWANESNELDPRVRSDAGHEGNLGAFPLLRHTDSIIAEVYPNFNTMPTARHGVTISGAQNGTTPSSSNPLQTLVQVSKLQRLLEQEQVAGATLQEEVQALQAKLHALERKRVAEGRRALLEGARFEVWLPTSMHSKTLTVWFSHPAMCIRLAENRTSDPKKNGNYSPRRSVGADKGPDSGSASGWKAVSVKQLVRVQTGSSLFPSEPQGAMQGLKLWAKKLHSNNGGAANPPAPGPTSTAPGTPHNGNDLRCMSLVLAEDQCIHLQLPAAGNGRSRDEWAAAFTDLALEYGQGASGAHSFQPESSQGSRGAGGHPTSTPAAEASDSSGAGLGPTSHQNSDSSSPLITIGLPRINTGRSGSHSSLDKQPTHTMAVSRSADGLHLRKRKGTSTTDATN